MTRMESRSGQESRPQDLQSFRYQFANAEVDESRFELRVDGLSVALEPRPLYLLIELLRHPDTTLSRQSLLATVWQGRPTVDNVLPNAIRKLRVALGDAAAAHLVTVTKIGYRLDGPVRRLPAESAASGLAILQAGAEVPGRPGFRLVEPLGRDKGGWVWRASHATPSAGRVFKFAAPGAQAAQLRREATVYRALQYSLGERSEFVKLISANLESIPNYLEMEDAGPFLPTWFAMEPAAAMHTVSQRLKLFLQLAEGIGAAHSIGVIHGDIRPSNIAISGQADAWTAKLTNFGGRPGAGDAGSWTGAESMAEALSVPEDPLMADAAPRYLAPELDADDESNVQGDLFALGVVLYQWLTGDFGRPMSTGWERDIADEWLCKDLAAATEGQPKNRLGSVAEWIDRLERLDERRADAAHREALEREAATARAKLALEDARRPWKRAAAGTLAVSTFVSLWFAQGERQALAVARTEAASVQALNDFLIRDVIQAADATSIPNGKEVSLKTVLEHASSAAGRAFAAQPELEAGLRMEIGGAFQRMSDFGAAESELREAIRIAAKSPAVPKALAVRLGYRLSRLLSEKSRLVEAKSLLNAADQQVLEEGLTQRDDLRLEALLAHFGYDFMRQDFKAATAGASNMLILSDTLNAADPVGGLRIRNQLADAFYRVGDFARAEALLEQALALDSPRGTLGAGQLARVTIQRARVHLAQGKVDSVEADLLHGRDTLADVVGKDDYFVAVANMELGNLYAEHGRFADAEAALRTAHGSMSRTMGPDHQSTRIVGLNLALVALETGAVAEAVRRLEDARPWFVASFGGERAPVVQSIDFHRARGHRQIGDPKMALELLNRVEPEMLAQAEPGRFWQARLDAERGAAYLAAGRLDEGKSMLSKGLRNMEAQGAPAWTISALRQQSGRSSRH